MAKKNKRYVTKRRPKFPVIGKYVDTITKAELKVVHFIDDIGNFKLTIADGISTTLNGCRFQMLVGDVKSKRKFYKLLQPWLSFSSGLESGMDFSPTFQLPLVFGLLKIRKGKVRRLVLFESVSKAYGQSKIINVIAAKVDNLLYLDLLAKHKTIPLTGEVK